MIVNCYLKKVLIKLWQIWQNVRDDYEDTVLAGKMDAKERSMTQAPMSSRVTDCWLVNSLLRNRLFGARPCWSFICIHTASMLASRRPLFHWKKLENISLRIALLCFRVDEKYDSDFVTDCWLPWSPCSLFLCNRSFDGLSLNVVLFDREVFVFFDISV